MNDVVNSVVTAKSNWMSFNIFNLNYSQETT